jgi:hypothetical protein
VKPELRDLQISPDDAVNHPVLVRDSARPETRQGMLQRLRLSDPVGIMPITFYKICLIFF